MKKIITKRPKKPHLSLPCGSGLVSQGLKSLPFTLQYLSCLKQALMQLSLLFIIGLVRLIIKTYKIIEAYRYKKLTAKYAIMSAIFVTIFALISVGPSEEKREENIQTVIAISDEKNEFGHISNQIGWESWDEDFILPVNGYKSQGYNRAHSGIDYAAEIYSAIRPITSGKVIHTGWETGGYGITVIIDHDHNLIARYAHMAKTNVKVGDTVRTESVIGEVGLTGHTTGPHVHIELYDNSKNINPEDFIPLTR